MAKTNFSHGEFVSGKRFDGTHFIGVYEHSYDCGDHLVFDGTTHFCVHKKDCHYANENEIKQIKETIVTAIKKTEKEKKEKKKNSEVELTEDEIEEMLTEE